MEFKPSLWLKKIVPDLLHVYTHKCSHTMCGCIFCAQTKPLKVYHFHTGGTKSSHYEGEACDIQPLEDECLMFSDWSCSFVWLALLCFTVAVDFFFVFTQWSDLACSERLVSPRGDVGLNSRVWSDYVSAVWEIPLGPVGSLHILCWQ